jgi:hypothetical protein
VDGAILLALQKIATDKNGHILLAELERTIPGGLEGLGACTSVRDRVKTYMTEHPDPPIFVDQYFLHRCGGQLTTLARVIRTHTHMHNYLRS